jgi:tripartite-type tricarboxylate transporter receptor subunit TctC
MNRRFLMYAVTLATLSLSFASHGTTFPSKPIRILVPYAPGGSVDVVARIVGQKLAGQLGQPVIIDNKPGASEQLAISTLTMAPADGHTLLLATTVGMAVNPPLYGKALRYDPLKDLTPVIELVTSPSVVVVNPTLNVKSLAELTAYLKAHPGSASYGSAGVGAPSHLGMERYKRATGVDVVHVPYRGGAPALQGLMGNEIQVMMALAPEAMPIAQSGKLRALALASPTRSALYPDLPTTAEQGLPGFTLDLWFALVAPAGTPSDVVKRLNSELNVVLRDKAVAAQLNDRGLNVVGGDAEKVLSLTHTDTVEFKKIIDDVGIKPE